MSGLKKFSELQIMPNSIKLKKLGMVSDKLQSQGERKAVLLFQRAAVRVPAYRDFLKKNKVSPAKIRTVKDLTLVPPMTKADYLHAYPLERMVWNGVISKAVFSTTSGSTGHPSYFPRDKTLETQSADYHELFLKNNNTAQKRTLVIIGFGMGAWVGGSITFEAFRELSRRGYNLTIFSPGSNKKEMLDGVKHLASYYEQLILCGYPPFLKDVLEQGEAEGINWKRYNVKIIFAAEAFSEKFRDFIASKVGMSHPDLATTNIYGTADLGTMALETPFTVRLRRAALSHPNLYRDIFGSAGRLPTLAQFHPAYIHFEAPEGEILYTGDSVLPLIRYQPGDRGGVLKFKEIMETLRINRRWSWNDTTICPWPSVYVYERSDLATKLYGAIIYPEHVREALTHPRLIRHLTGKFTLMTQHDREQNEFLEVHLELQRTASRSRILEQRAQDIIRKSLLVRNAEYNYLFGLMPKRVEPRLVFWPHEDPLHFRASGKQKWVKTVLN